MGTATLPNNQQLSAALTDPNQFTNVVWAALVIALAGAPVTQNNVDNFTSWMLAENAGPTWTGTAGANNPLNNGLGSGGGNGTGSYPDLITAAYYAAKGIEGGISGAAPISAALKANAPFSIFHQATVNASWSGDHYAGTAWLAQSSPEPPPAVSVTDAAKHASTHNPSIGNVTELGGPGQGIAGTIGSSLNQLTGGVAGDIVGAAKAAVSWTDSLGTILSDVSSANFWKRVGLFTAGVVFIIGGIILFISTTKTGQRAESTALEGAEIGAIA